MGALDRLLTRAATPRGGLGNLRINPAPGGGKGRIAAGTSSVTYVSEGSPLSLDWGAEEQARNAYLGSVYVMRCARLIADTIAGLPWVAGPDPTDPSVYDKTTPLASLLGPSTPQAPGGPNNVTSARALWAWSIVQYLITGRFGWECQLDGTGKTKEIVGLWPLVSACLAPKPTMGGSQWFDGFEYSPATGNIELTNDQVVYCWRPSIIDWRMPESVVQSATFPVYIATGIERYMANLLKNNMVATTMVIGPPFDETDQRRAWQDQFLSEHTGIDKAGSTIFGEVEAEDDDPAGRPLVQVERLAQTPVDTQMTDLKQDAQIDICIAFGVPRSLIGDASQRTYANASSEYKNFWTLTVLDLIAELQDHLNLNLAPRLGNEHGWFDLSRVSAVQPPSIFMPPDIASVIETGVADAAQIANILGIPAADATTDSDTDTIEIGEESSTPGPGGGARGLDWAQVLEHRSRPVSRFGPELELRAAANPTMLRYFEEAQLRMRAPINTWTLAGLRKPWEPLGREVIHVQSTRAPQPALSTTGAGIDKAVAIIEQVEGIRALALADRKAKKVHDVLSENYPESTLGWVDGADWSEPKQVPLSDIQMDRRPGGRDQAKVQGIAKALTSGTSSGASAPVVLVKTPDSDKLKVADGYHRTLAHKRVGHTTVPAYVGEVDDSEGPWDSEMHDKKLNRADLLQTRNWSEWDIDRAGSSHTLALRKSTDAHHLTVNGKMARATGFHRDAADAFKAEAARHQAAGEPGLAAKASDASRAHLQAALSTSRAARGRGTKEEAIAASTKANHAMASLRDADRGTHRPFSMDDVLDAKGVRYDTSPLGEGKNWVNKVGGLPLFARAIAHALIRNGHTESDAIQIAIGVMKDWAGGGGKVTPKTRAKAAEAIAHWEAMKGMAHAS